MISETELNNIHRLLSCEDETMRELGVITAIGSGMTLDELIDKCVDDNWYYDETGPFNRQPFNCYYIFNNNCIVVYNIEGTLFHVFSRDSNSYYPITLKQPVKFIKNQLKELFEEYLLELNINYK